MVNIHVGIKCKPTLNAWDFYVLFSLEVNSSADTCAVYLCVVSLICLLGKSKLKHEMKSYQEMVVKQIRQMSEDNQQLHFYKNKVAKEQRQKKALEESFGLLSERLRKTTEENRIVRHRTKMQHEQNKEEVIISILDSFMFGFSCKSADSSRPLLDIWFWIISVLILYCITYY